MILFVGVIYLREMLFVVLPLPSVIIDSFPLGYLQCVSYWNIRSIMEIED